MAKKPSKQDLPPRGARDIGTDDCIFPPVIPAEEAGKYGVNRDPHAEGDIADYVLGQSPRGEVVKHVELVTTQHVMGTAYDIWDVTTSTDRFWVLTPPTNLYSQKHFTSLDYTLSFHIGLMMRVQSRHSGARGEPSPFDEVMRRHQHASALLDEAVEAEQFQGVGMALRECLVVLVTAMRRRVDMPEDATAPKAADFKGWSDALLNRLCPGPSNQTLRSYLKHTADQMWQLVNWLTHSSSADDMSASIAVEGVSTIIGHFLSLVVRERTGGKVVCPRCSSRNLRNHFDVAIGTDGDYFTSCGECGWHDHPEPPRNRSPRGTKGVKRKVRRS